MWFGIVAPFAIFSALRSLRRIRASDGELHGVASAIAGLIAALVALLVVVGGVTYWIAAS